MIGKFCYQILKLYVGPREAELHILKVKKIGCLYKTPFHQFSHIPYGTKFLRGKMLMNLTNFQQFINIFLIKILHLATYR